MKRIYAGLFAALLVLMVVFPISLQAQVPENLYLIGNATSAGWNLESKIPMNKTNGDFIWEGYLQAGELKFLTQNDWLPSYGPTEDRPLSPLTQKTVQLSLRESYDASDDKFMSITPGYYSFRIRITGDGSSAVLTTYPSAVNPVGTATTTGWGLSALQQIPETEFGSGLYVGSTSLRNGTLAFKQQNNGYYYGPANNGESVSLGVATLQNRTCVGGITKVMAVTPLSVTTDKACYSPGATVTFTSSSNLPSGAMVRYLHMGTMVGDPAEITGNSWTWIAPASDYKGYMAEIYTRDDNTETILGTIAVDVSSDWKRFPRYGFIATFTPQEFNDGKTDEKIAEEMAWLNRCHINGVQFQDWHYKHHWPCPKYNDDGSLYDCYEDLSNRWNSSKVIKKYIDVQHAYGMKSIFYNLAFGVLGDWVEDMERNSAGWCDDWFLYEDPIHTTINKHGLKSIGWKSDIYLTNPANSDWLNWLKARNTEVYNEFGFDGYQIDQLGDRGNLYDKNGNHVNLYDTYPTFINSMKSAHPDKRLIMNAVSEYGTWGISQTRNVDFLYNEVWGNYEKEDQMDRLFFIIRDNKKMNSDLQTVFAAYMNYDAHDKTKPNYKTEFNTPGILLTDAVIFALGGAHLELGDHMLCSEYFPNDDMKMSDDLKAAMVNYYDFHTAYENLLRDNGEELATAPSITSSSIGVVDTKVWYSTNNNGTISVTNAENGKVMTYSRRMGDKTVISLLNFMNSNSLSWRDKDADRNAPTEISNLVMSVSSQDKITRVWVASPDYLGGAMQSLTFTQIGEQVTFIVPNLKYWTMIVMETGESGLAASDFVTYSITELDSELKDYSITIDASQNKIIIENPRVAHHEKLYAIGEATEGWDFSKNAVPLEKTLDGFSLKTYLFGMEMKLCELTSDDVDEYWKPYYLHAWGPVYKSHVKGFQDAADCRNEQIMGPGGTIGESHHIEDMSYDTESEGGLYDSKFDVYPGYYELIVNFADNTLKVKDYMPYQRITVSSAGIATFMSPFDIADVRSHIYKSTKTKEYFPTPDNAWSSSDWTTDGFTFNFYAEDKAENETLELTRVESISGSTPYIIKADPGIYYLKADAPASNEKINRVSNGSVSEVGDGLLRGNWHMSSPLTQFEGYDTYLLQKQNGVVAFYLTDVEKSYTISPYSCYLRIPNQGGAKMFSMQFNDETVTDINNAEESSVPVAVYTLDGIRKDNISKGINIVRYANGTTKIIIDK